MPLQQSQLIWRKQLNALSGGKAAKNPLNLTTPISFTGGSALAMKNKVVAHITVKEKNNLALPETADEDFVLWRIGSKRTSDILYITERNEKNEYKHSNGIPLFWEPKNQEHGETKVFYAGHWKIKDHSFEKRNLKDHDRCGSMTFRFDRFDAKFPSIIAKARQMTVEKIKSYDFDSLQANTADTENITKDQADDGPEQQTALMARRTNLILQMPPTL